MSPYGQQVAASASLSALLDAGIGNARGTFAYRNGSAWVALGPGTLGQVLQTRGPSADPIWATVSGVGTVVQVDTGTGLTGGPITSTGTISVSTNGITYALFQQVAASSLVGNPTGALANAQGITLGATLAFSGTALQTAALTGDVTASANSFATTIAPRRALKERRFPVPEHG